MKYLLAVAALFLFYAVARAGVYSYRDENGTLHAVSSPDDIPAQYRGKEKQLSGAESGSGEVNIKLEREGNSLLVPVSFGAGNEYLMILDTGASVSMISNRIAEKIKARQTGMLRISTANGLVQVAQVEVPEISLRQFTVRNLRITVNDMHGGSRAQGLLGLDFFNHFRIQLDSETGQLHLERK